MIQEAALSLFGLALAVLPWWAQCWLAMGGILPALLRLAGRRSRLLAGCNLGLAACVAGRVAYAQVSVEHHEFVIDF